MIELTPTLLKEITVAVLSLSAVYWLLRMKINQNTRDIKAMQTQHQNERLERVKAIQDSESETKYYCDTKLALLQSERKTCNEKHEGKFERIDMMLTEYSKKSDAMIETLGKQTELLQKLSDNIVMQNLVIEKHLTYHETIEKVKK